MQKTATNLARQMEVFIWSTNQTSSWQPARSQDTDIWSRGKRNQQNKGTFICKIFATYVHWPTIASVGNKHNSTVIASKQ